MTTAASPHAELSPAIHSRMHQGIQKGELLRIAKDKLSQHASVNRPVRGENLQTERLHHKLLHRLSAGHQAMRHKVGVAHGSPRLEQELPHQTLPTRDSTRNGHPFHAILAAVSIPLATGRIPPSE